MESGAAGVVVAIDGASIKGKAATTEVEVVTRAPWGKLLQVAWFWPLRQEDARASRAASPATCVCLRVLCRATLRAPRPPGEPLSGPHV